MKLLLALLPLLYWPHAIETAPQLKQAGIEQIATPPEAAEAWRNAGFKVTALPKNELEGRERLLIPGVARRTNVASPTRVPWVDSNGWRFLRKPDGQFFYDVPRGRAGLAAMEAFVYRADAVIKIDPADLPDLGQMLAFLRTLPNEEMPPIADFTLQDDGSTTSAEVMNLLLRRNLLFRLVTQPSSLYRLHVKIGSRDYPLDEAADPSAFAQKIRKQIGDDNRAIRLYGSEVVIARLSSDSTKTRLQLLNYGGREIEGLRVRLRGKFGAGMAQVFGVGRVALAEVVSTKDAIEFTIPKMLHYAVIELPAGK